MGDVPVLRAGDTLIVSFGREVSDRDRDAFARQVEEGMPGVRVAFLENVTGLVVFRPGAAEGE